MSSDRGHDVRNLGLYLWCRRCGQRINIDDAQLDWYGWDGVLSAKGKERIVRWVSSWCPADGHRPTHIAEERRDCRP